MAIRQMVTYNNGKVAETIPVEDWEYRKVTDLLSNRPLFEVMAELENSLNKSKQEIKSQLANLDARHAGPIREAEQKVNQSRQDLLQADNDLREAVRAGKYSEAPAIEARKVELQQAILAAEVGLASTTYDAAGERANFLKEIAGGRQGSGATIDGLDYRALKNITNAILFDWANNRMAVDVVGMVSQQAQLAGDQAHVAREQVKEAEKALADYRQVAQARYSGAGVKVTGVAPIQPSGPRAPFDWGEVGRPAGII